MGDLYDDGDYRKSGLGQKRTNTLLIRRPTGKVKPTTYNLPPEGFTYGKRDQFDEEGVREVVGSWQSHVLAPESRPGRDFVRLNKSAVVCGAINSQEISQFRSTNDIRLRSGPNASLNRGGKLTDVLDPNITFGKPSKATTPINDVICNSYQRQWIADQRALQEKRERQEANQKANKQKGSSMHTRASLGHMKVVAPLPKPVFKMAKFANVGARIAMPRSAPSISESGQSQSFNSNNTDYDITSYPQADPSSSVYQASLPSYPYPQQVVAVPLSQEYQQYQTQSHV